MTKLFQAHQMKRATRNGEISTDKLTSENFALIALECYHHSIKENLWKKNQKPSSLDNSMVKVDDILDGTDNVLGKAVELTLKKLFPRGTGIANALESNTFDKSSYIDFETLDYLSTEKYCRSPEFLNKFKKQYGVSYPEFRRQLLEEIRKTPLYNQLRFKEMKHTPTIGPAKKSI